MKIYCDGACSPNPGLMGVGIYVLEVDYQDSIFCGPGTNQKAELIALTEACLIWWPGDEIYTDSKYAIGMAGHWKAKTNIKEVRRLRNAIDGRQIPILWVRGHNGDVGQEMADSLAVRAINDHIDELESSLDWQGGDASLSKAKSGAPSRLAGVKSST